jgi:hypothetical protein
LKTTHSR